MFVFAVIIGVITVSSYSTAAETSLDEQYDVANSQPTGAKLLPFVSLLQSDSYQHNKDHNYPSNNDYKQYPNKRCPKCDSSVYPYCGEKLLHDACCCTNPYLHELPYQCRLADCRFLHSNNCREHRLIASCCCSDDYRSLLKSFSRT